MLQPQGLGLQVLEQGSLQAKPYCWGTGSAIMQLLHTQSSMPNSQSIPDSGVTYSRIPGIGGWLSRHPTIQRIGNERRRIFHNVGH